ncbi:shikimate kinase [Pelagibius sp.]|uniref:shikimate kinase n=1 Tax=Pelagibius sp. TaxID=1931238 RepID=UPI00261AF5AC|nr:shikimate kinase [Pelagibius sp.]
MARSDSNGSTSKDSTSAKESASAKDGLEVPRTIVFVGLMGAGKSCIGRNLAAALDLPFVDADKEIEAAAGCSIEDIFEEHGEEAFRAGERRVIARLLNQPTMVLATGGGAFMDPDTRKLIHQRATSVWLRADLDLLLRRTARRNNRPLLKRGDPRQILSDLIALRYPVYAEADVTVDSVDGPPEVTLGRVIEGLRAYAGEGGRSGSHTNKGRSAAL